MIKISQTQQITSEPKHKTTHEIIKGSGGSDQTPSCWDHRWLGWQWTVSKGDSGVEVDEWEGQQSMSDREDEDHFMGC